MKVIRRKRKKDKKKKILIAVLIVIFVLALAVAAFFVYRSYIASTKYSKIKDVEATNTCTLINNESVNKKLAKGDICLSVLPKDIDESKIEFSSSDDSIVIVDSGGRIDALREGQAQVVAKGRKFEATCNVTVTKGRKLNNRVYTSAYTANLDWVEKNSKNKDKNLYMIQVNRQTNVVTVYTYDDIGQYRVPVRSMISSCGTEGNNITPTGSFKIYSKKRWLALYGDCFGQYVSCFNGDILFHSVPYDKDEKPNTLEKIEFNKLGENASLGCVRLCVSDAKWIYDNCDLDTVVKVIDSGERADPLGKPEMIKIKYNVYWDPTDTDTDNPFIKLRPRLEGVKNQTIELGENVNILKGVSAEDTCGNDVTKDIKAIGNVITNKKGTYKVRYEITDTIGKKTYQEAVITVK